MSEQATSKIMTAISKIMGEVGSVEKRGTNAFHNYKYASAADVSHALQKLLSTNGVVIIQTEKSMEWKAEDTVMLATYEFTLAHVSGETWNEKVLQTGMATLKNSKGGIDDKAANKCHTAARKYFLLALFQIPTGDYDDADADEDKAPAQSPTPKTLKQRMDGFSDHIDRMQSELQVTNLVASNNKLMAELKEKLPQDYEKLSLKINQKIEAFRLAEPIAAE